MTRCVRGRLATNIAVAVAAAAPTTGSDVPSSCALSALELLSGSNGEAPLRLFPSFSPELRRYSAWLDYAVQPLWVQPTPSGGCLARRGDAIGSIDPGTNGEVQVFVAGEGGDPQEY